MPRLLSILAVVSVALRIAVGIIEKPWSSAESKSGAGPVDPGHPDLVAWVEPDSAEAVAKRTGKPIFYEFSAAWCGPCRILSREVFEDSAAAAAINGSCVPVHVVDRTVEDGKNAPTAAALQKRYKVVAFPTLVIERSGQEAKTIEGYPGKDEVLAWLKSSLE